MSKVRADTLVREIFTLEISRTSKSYSVTGWRIGYAVANPELSIEGARKFRNAHVPDLLDCPDAIPAYAHLIRSEGRRAHKASRAPSLASTPVGYLASLEVGVRPTQVIVCLLPDRRCPPPGHPPGRRR